MFKTTYTTSDDDADYDFDLNLQDFQLMADYHPTNSAFKITFGLLYNGSDFDGKVVPNLGTYEFQGHIYTIDAVRSINTKVDFDNSIAPYIGIGWDTSFYKPKNSWGFTFNIGLAYTGSATVTYTVLPGDEAQYNLIKDQLNADLEKERISLQDDLDDFKILPYISIGFNYKF